MLKIFFFLCFLKQRKLKECDTNILPRVLYPSPTLSGRKHSNAVNQNLETLQKLILISFHIVAMSFKKYVSNLQSCQDYIFFSHRQVSPTTIELEVNERVHTVSVQMKDSARDATKLEKYAKRNTALKQWGRNVVLL